MRSVLPSGHANIPQVSHYGATPRTADLTSDLESDPESDLDRESIHSQLLDDCFNLRYLRTASIVSVTCLTALYITYASTRGKTEEGPKSLEKGIDFSAVACLLGLTVTALYLLVTVPCNRSGDSRGSTSTIDNHLWACSSSEFSSSNPDSGYAVV